MTQINFPMKQLFLNQEAFKGIFQLKIIFINDSLRLQYNLFQFTGNLTESIIQSFQSNPNNEQLLKTLPAELFVENNLSLIESEQLYLYLQYILQTNQNSNQYLLISFPKINMYLLYNQVFSVTNFIHQFVNSYDILKLNLQVIQYKKDKIEDKKFIPGQSDYKVETPEEPKQEQTFIETEEITENDLLLLNDTLKLSPSPLITYYISKHINNIIDLQKREKFDLKIENNIISITINPLINKELLDISDKYYFTILNSLSSFNYSNDEYISKLKLLIGQIYFILDKINKKEELTNYFLSLKIIEFLIFIYTIKLYSDLSEQLQSSKQNSNQFMSLYLYYVNGIIQHLLTTYGGNTQQKIIFVHYPTIEYEDKSFSINNLKQILSKELYLADIDKDLFINRMLEKTSKPKKENCTVNLILSNPSILDINKIMTGSHTKNSLLYYMLLTPKQNQFINNRIITVEYYQILQIINTPSISVQLLSNIDPIITKYTDSIINVIFKELMNLDASTTVSTLFLINTYIRPYIINDLDIQTELFILYRIIIPYLYDSYNITTFIDYFH